MVHVKAKLSSNAPSVRKESTNHYIQLSRKSNPNKKRVVELEKMVQIIDKLFDIDDELNSLEYDEEKSKIIIDSETEKLENMKEKLVLSQKLLSEIDMCYTCPSCKKMLKIRENKLMEYENQDFNTSDIKKDIQTLKTDIIIKEKNINISNMGQGKLRMVTHLDYKQVMHDYVMETLSKINF